MRDFYKKINWLRALLSTVTAIALSLIFVLTNGKEFFTGLNDLIDNVIPDLVAVLIAIPIYIFYSQLGAYPLKKN